LLRRTHLIYTANKVIIFDVNWNPSYDEQAQDRAFRIGQTRDVEVTRLVARGTIEELIYQRQVYKVQLKKQTLEATELGEDQPQIFRGVDKDKNRKGELFGIENLLKFKDGSFMSSLVRSFSCLLCLVEVELS
jgi:SNF2 family DNA or RNA helicase